MKKEFNLSKRIIISNKYIDNFLYEEDVKEFIKRLKDLTALKKDQNDGRKEAILIQEIIIEIEKEINKLAGDKLI